MKNIIFILNLLILSIFTFNFKVNAYTEWVQAVIDAVNHVNTSHPGWWWAQVSINWSVVSAWCINWWATPPVSLSNIEINEVINAISSVSSVTVTSPPPPPPPVVSTTYSTTSCSYISWRHDVWWDCNINWSWNNNGTISCVQNGWYEPDYSNATLSCSTTTTDWVVTSSSCDPCPGNAPQPSNPSPVTKTVTANLASTSSTCNWSVYANNSDSCKVTLNLSSPTEQWRWINSWWSNGNISNITDISWEKSDRINNTWNALNFSSVSASNISNTTWNNFNIDISWIKSTTPFSTNSWKISLKLGSTQMTVQNINYNFKKPFVWTISTWDNINSNWSWTPRIWTLGQYKLSLVQRSNISPNSLTSYSLDNFTSKIEPVWNWVSTQSNSVTTTTLSDTSWTTFNSRLNTTAWANSLNQNPWLQVNNPIIKYSLGWQNVSYYLTQDDASTDTTPIKTTWTSFMSIKVEGSAQGAWKSNLTWQAEAVSNLYPNDMRTQLRKNTYNYIKNMSTWETLNWVKYVEWDITISWDQTYETLVVKDWNVIISWNLNPSNNKFWIIVLRDAYDVNDWYTKKWNIYIKPNVTKINALIYSDWWIVSVDNSGNVYSWDSTWRTQDLNKQLILNWSFFTRNTIWWAILAWGDYLLPGWSKTQDFDLSMQYDLNYLRRWNAGCDLNSNWNCTDSWETWVPVLIKYNPSAQTNPPKLFN
jgi:hypothetical protein